MAESPEHHYLSQIFLTILNDFSHSQLYTYRESDRGKFDIACMLAETWNYLLNGQTLWKHTEGIDKDIRTLLVASDAPLVTYVARDTTKHRSVFAEAVNDYRKIRRGPNLKHFKVFWVPADFDADSEKQRSLIESQLQNEIAEDILFNVLFGRLNASRVHAAIMMGSNVARPGLDLAVLHTIAVDGFVSLGFLSHKFKVSSNTVRDRISRLQMSGLVLQERRAGEAYYVGPAGRAFLRLSSQLHRLVCDGLALSVESTEIFKMLDAEPFEISQVDRNFTTGHLDRNDPKMIFAFWVGKAEMAEKMWGINWDQCDYKYLPDEQNYSRWLTL